MAIDPALAAILGAGVTSIVPSTIAYRLDKRKRKDDQRIRTEERADRHEAMRRASIADESARLDQAAEPMS